MRTGAVIAAAGISGGYYSYEQMERISGPDMLRRMITSFKRAGVDDVVVITGYQAEETEKHLARLGVVFLRSPGYRTEEMITSAVRGLTYLKERCERIFFCPAGVPLFQEETLQKMKVQPIPKEPEIIIPVWEGRKGHPILIDSRLTDRLASYHGEGGLKEAFRVQKIPVNLLTVEDEGVAVYTGKKDEFERIYEHKEQHRTIHPKVKVQLEKNLPFFGPGIMTLIRQIDSLGSVREACLRTGISYSKGWNLIHLAEEELGYTVVERCPGGKNGGTARVSSQGNELLKKYEQLERAIAEYAEEKFREVFM